MMIALLFAQLVAFQDPPRHSVDWIALTQTPFAGTKRLARSLPQLNVDIGKVKTPSDWQRARESIQARWSEILGKSPQKSVGLQVQSGKSEALTGFTRRKVSFASEGDDRLEAFLLCPSNSSGAKKTAAVVVFHETTPSGFRHTAGLDGDSDRAIGVELVRRGYIVLCPQCFILRPSGNGEGPMRWAKSRAAELRRRRPGWSGMGKLTFDASRCVDFLESIPEVDPARIGCIGFSLGAKEVIYAMAFEPRLKAAVADEAGIGIEMSNWHDEWYLGPSILKQLDKIDHHQLLALAAPRALMIQGGGSADGPKSWPYVEAALPIYELLGAKCRLGLFDHHGGHSFPPDARRVAYEWLDCWLQHNPSSTPSR